MSFYFSQSDAFNIFQKENKKRGTNTDVVEGDDQDPLKFFQNLTVHCILEAQNKKLFNFHL
jgi:hypothetical protein